MKQKQKKKFLRYKFKYPDKHPIPQSLPLQPPADQKACRPWVRN